MHPRYPLLVAANRDEFHARATAPLARWADEPGLVAGRDLVAGGTWFGVADDGRFAALTNFRDGVARAPGLVSRGALVTDFLRHRETPMRARDYCASVLASGSGHAGFNLFACDGTAADDELVWCSNRAAGVRVLAPAVYGLSNHLLDTPWPKVRRGKQRFAQLLAQPEPDPQTLFGMLSDRGLPDDHELPDTGVGVERERALAASFIVDPGYGTRASTLLLLGADRRGRIIERSFGADGGQRDERVVTLGAGDNAPAV